MTTEQIISKLRARVEQSGSIRKAAIALGISNTHLGEILDGKRDPGPKVLAQIGVERVIIYRTAETK